MIFKVKVRGICHSGPLRRGRLQSEYFTVLVEATDSSEALNAGCCYVVNTAPSDVLWKEIEALEAAPFEIPMTLKRSARLTIGRAAVPTPESPTK